MPVPEKYFWKKLWDKGLTDMDPQLFETSFIKSLQPIFEKYASKMALEFEGIEITFSDLTRYSNKFAQMLIKQGLKRGDVIGINLPNTPQYVIALLGALKAGCVVTGVSPLLSEEQMQYQLHDCGAKGLVTLDAIFEKRLLTIIDQLPDLQVIVATDVIDFLPKVLQVLGHAIKKVPKGKVTPIPGKKVVQFMPTIKGEEYPDVMPPLDAYSPDDLIYILYTGGTTGAPKGAMLTNRNIVADLLIIQKWLSWEEGKGVACSGFPFFHIAGLTFCQSCMLFGWTQLLVPNPRDTDHICKLMKKYQVTILVNVPSLYQMLLKNPKFKLLDHSRLENCISAAAPFPAESQKELEAAVGTGKLLEVYGMTETSPLTVMNPSRGKRKLGYIGLPILNTDIKLCDAATGKEVNLGEPGEICAKGPMVMQGYWHKPEESKNVLIEGYMHTGDVAVFDDEGYLRIVDRTKDMLIVSGYKVFSSKCEDILAKHPAIDMVAFVGIPNPERPGSELVKAYITIKPDYSYDGNVAALKENIANWAKDKLAPYEVPKFLEVRKEFPLTVVGKIDKKVLRKEAREVKQ